jgi:hypothetical protein
LRSVAFFITYYTYALQAASGEAKRMVEPSEYALPFRV